MAKTKNGVYIISSPKEAEQVLRINEGRYDLVFDISKKLQVNEVPLCLRKCKRCEKPSEYLGFNIWGHGFEKRSTYCQHCGFALETISQVAIAVQGNFLVQCGYRLPDEK